MSAIDLVISFYRLLNVPAITGLLGDGKVWRYQRPLNSDKVDVVISVPEYVGGSFNVSDVEINVYAPNIQNFEPLGYPDPTHPDVVKLKAVTEAILTLLDGYSVKVAGKLVQDKSGVWYSNIVVEVTEIDQGLSTEVALWESSLVPDGYGGSTATFGQVWSGRAAQDNIRKDDQLEVNAGRYEMLLRCDWLIPSDEVTPQKNMELRTAEGDYVIRSIVPDSAGGMWRITTVRKDAVRL